MEDGSVGSVGTRKKFATPPVKIACLACRASRTRCDGKKPCANCRAKSRDCVYRPSRRGGARVRKNRKAQDEAGGTDELGSCSIQQESLPIENYVDPGAGLRQLPDWAEDSDLIFDSLFTIPNGNAPDSSGFGECQEAEYPVSNTQGPVVRSYRGDHNMQVLLIMLDGSLEAYYIFIHPYFPILPPPVGIPQDNITPRYQNQIESFEQGFEPVSPVALAISSLLAPIPCPSDTDYQSHESVLFRRRYAHYQAQAAIESIETESEIPESSIAPHKALVDSPTGSIRESFHPSVPLEFEPIIALSLLSVYEYTQRGNLKKMQRRAGQALMLAIDLSLHCESEEDELSEVRRRVWWMTHHCASQAAVVGNTKPSFAVLTLNFTTKYPETLGDTEAFAVFLQGQHAILAASQFVIELKKEIGTGSPDMARMHEKMKELDSYLRPLVISSDSWSSNSTTTSFVDPAEGVVAQALRCMARIKLNSAMIKVHRYCAFLDLPVFSDKHCDLQAKPSGSEASRQSDNSSLCQCGPLLQRTGTEANGSSTTFSLDQTPSPEFPSSNSTTPSSAIGDSGPWCSLPFWTDRNNGDNGFSPFTSHYSSKVCLKSALAIVKAFENLPYPNPGSSYTQTSPHAASLPSPTLVPVPRTMPTFACCAMQCAYTLLMVESRTRAAYPGDPTSMNLLAASLLGVLREGLMSISNTLDNYAIASEALSGMRDQILSVSNVSYDDTFLSTT